jgi:hypothetical protein
MAVLAPHFVAGGVTIALLHAATPDPLAELASMEPGEIVLVGRIASPPEKSGFGYMADLRVEHLWYEGGKGGLAWRRCRGVRRRSQHRRRRQGEGRR